MSLEGKKAPAFRLEGSDGKMHSLSDYAGRTVVVYFYPKDNTPGCTKESCSFRDLNADIRKLGAVVLGVSRDNLNSHDKFITDHGLNFTLLSDPDLKMMKAYGAWGMKTMYGKDVEGTIRSTVVIGPDGRILKHWRTVKDAAEHPEQVVAHLKSL
ncbi:MAG: peroxiredoxin [Verrucomicrobia bacterium]|nr:peroxiredoxin [Verrucomicrobiota bacterium]